MVASAVENGRRQFPVADKTRVDFGNSDNVNVDPAFVLAPEFRPRKRHDIESDIFDNRNGVPVLDLSVLRSISKKDLPKFKVGNNETELELVRRKRLLVEEVGRACRDWGFFQVVNHGVEAELLNEVEAQMKKFFGLPRDEKIKVSRTDDNPACGYFDAELTKNVRDWKEVFDFAAQETAYVPESYDDDGVTYGERVYTNKWPANAPRFR